MRNKLFLHDMCVIRENALHLGYSRWKSGTRLRFMGFILSLKVLGKCVGLCKTAKRMDQLYIRLLVSIWRIICENFNPNGLILLTKSKTKTMRNKLFLHDMCVIRD